MFSKYRELGLALIPIKAGTKRPLESNWSKWCEILPTEQECEIWDSQSHLGFGLACGPASNIIALDIDSDDPKILEACPTSPVVKRGRKGQTRFFQYDSSVPSSKVAGCIDVLALGRQTVLPPTIHPDTGQAYVWLTPDTLENYNVKDLPVFTGKMLEKLKQDLESPTTSDNVVDIVSIDLKGPFYGDGDPKHPWPHGSQDRLKKICNGMIARGASPDEAVRELLRYDEENHKPIGYFFCEGLVSDQSADPVSNALFFYTNNLRTFNRRQIKSGQTPIVPLVSGSEMIDISDLTIAETKPWEPTPWPMPKGLLKDVYDLIWNASLRDQPGLALGGAISIGAVILSNKAIIDNTWPNMYVINVALTGAGKSFPYSIAKALLSQERGFNLLGSGGYRSSSAILKDFPARRERLDLVDECGGLFKIIRDGGVFQQDMMDILNNLWSSSNTVFLGPDSVGQGSLSVWNPCVSALFSTTPSEIQLSMSRDFLTRGFLPRCLIFNEVSYGQIKTPIWDQDEIEFISGKLLKLHQSLSQSFGVQQNLMAPKATPTPIPVSQSARRLLNEHGLECAEELAMSDTDEIKRYFLSRSNQIVQKLSLIHGAMHKLMVDIDDVAWAIKTVQASFENSLPLLPQLGAENIHETNVMRILAIIKRFGKIAHTELLNKTRFLKSNDLKDILGTLEDSGQIKIVLKKTKTKPVREYYINA